MKKTISLVISALMLVTATACADKSDIVDLKPENIPVSLAEDDKLHEKDKQFITALDLPQYLNEGIYNDEVVNLLPNTQGPPETYQELMADTEENEKIDSLYRITISEVIRKSEAENLNGWSKGRGDQNAVFYKGVIEYDYLNDKEMNEEIIFRMPGTIQTQRENNPPFSAGDVIAVVTQYKEQGSDITRLFKSYAFIYDILSVNGAEYAFVRGQSIPELESTLVNYLSEASLSMITTTATNPVTYFGAYNPNDIAQKLSELWD